MARAGADVEEFARHMEENCLSAGGGDGRPRLLWRRCSFRHEMESGSREGEELRRVWSKLRQEELQAAAWLEEEVQSSFQQEADDQVPGCKPCLVLTVAFPVRSSRKPVQQLSSCLHLLVKTNWARWSGEGRWLTYMAR